MTVGIVGWHDEDRGNKEDINISPSFDIYSKP